MSDGLVAGRAWPRAPGATRPAVVGAGLAGLVVLAGWLVQAATVGAGVVGDAFNAVARLSAVLVGVAVVGPVATLVPAYGPAVPRDDPRLRRAVGPALGWALAVSVPAGAVLALAAGPVASVLGVDLSAVAAARILVRAAGAGLPCWALAAVAASVLRAARREVWPKAATLLWVALLVVVYLGYRHVDGDPQAVRLSPSRPAVTALAWGATAAVAVVAVTLLIATAATGLLARPTLRAASPSVVAARGGAVAAAGPALAVLVLLLVTAHRGPRGSVTVLGYVEQLALLPWAMAVVPLVTSVLPRLAVWARAGDRVRLARLSSVATRAVVLIAAVGVAVLEAVAPAAGDLLAQLQPAAADRVDVSVSVLLTVGAPGLVGAALMLLGTATLAGTGARQTAVVASWAGWSTVVVVALVGAVLVGPGTGVVPVVGAATALGALVGGASVTVAVARTAGRAALAGLVRTLVVVLVAGTAGALAGRWVAVTVTGLFGADVLPAAGAVLGGALLAGVVAVAGAVLGDAPTVRELAVAVRRRHQPGWRPR